jgi:hypothetical protein
MAKFLTLFKAIKKKDNHLIMQDFISQFRQMKGMFGYAVQRW